LILLLALGPIGLWLSKPALPIPDGVTRLYQPGKINVVEFADYQCPYCRTMHAIFERINRDYGDRVNFHQLNMPLPGHEYAMKAAAAAVCAENAGKGAQMKDLLFTRMLDDEAPLAHARELGLDPDEFQQCLDSAATARQIEADKAILLNSGFRGLPTTFVGQQRIVGWRVYPAMKEAYELAARADGGRGLEIPPWLFLTLVGAAAVGIAVLGHARGNGLAKD
jgi:protein-disulfide isomerase